MTGDYYALLLDDDWKLLLEQALDNIIQSGPPHDLRARLENLRGQVGSLMPARHVVIDLKCEMLASQVLFTDYDYAATFADILKRADENRDIWVAAVTYPCKELEEEKTDGEEPGDDSV